MPIFNLTIDDTSPLIRYAPAGVWGDSSHTDPYWQSYSNGTFHPTNHTGATATLTFNGSAVYLYGAFRGNHDQYSVTLDGTTTVKNGYSNGVELFQQLMFSATNLNDDEHSLVLKNTYTTANPSWVDVDYILVTSGNGDSASPSIDTVLDDGDASITYSDGWSETPNSLITDYYNNTYHVTNTIRASATISFEGNAITVYGATSGNHGAFTVALDGGVSIALNGSATAFRPQNMLYYAGGLSNDSHTLSIVNIDSPLRSFDLDKVVISKWLDNSASSSTNSTGSSQPSASSTKPSSHVGAIVGGVIGGVAFLILVLLGFLFLRRRHREKTNSDGFHDHPSAQFRRNNVSASREPMMIEPFHASRVISVPHADPGSTSATGPSSDATPWPLNASQFGQATQGSSSVVDQSSASLPLTSLRPSKQASSSALSSQATTQTYAQSISAITNSSRPSRQPTFSMSDGSVVEDLPPPNYAEATASSPDNNTTGRWHRTL